MEYRHWVNKDIGYIQIWMEDDEFPSLCSARIVHGIGCMNDDWERLTSKQINKAYKGLMNFLIEQSADWEEHIIVASHNTIDSRFGYINFLDMAKACGWDTLATYHSRVSGNTCELYMYNISVDEKEEYGGDVTQEEDDWYDW